MKTIKGVVIVAVVCWSTLQAVAIEGLKLAIQCPNVVLSWPSTDGATYIVQYRPTLNTNDPWTVLTNSFPAATGTNMTFFVHSNAVVCTQNGTNSGGGGGGSGGPPTPNSLISLSSIESVAAEPETSLMVMPLGGACEAVPVMLYPPGFDFSNFIIFDPSTEEWVSGAGLTLAEPVEMLAANTASSPAQLDAASGSNGTSSTDTPTTGFYQVVQQGVQIWSSSLSNLTTGYVSNLISIPFEAGNDVGDLDEITVLVDGIRYRGVIPLLAPEISGALQVDTSFLENGDHTFQLMAGWRLPEGADINNDTIHAFSDIFTLTVTNEICFPDWEDEIGELGFAYYSFKTTCTNADWQIDIYDVSNNLAKTLTGHTMDGNVETNWNLLDIPRPI